MRIVVTIFLVLISIIVSAQQKYQSLLWEISSPYAEKSSYLYGTMHVSDKIAYRLSDTFFNAIDKADIIALESDPRKWLDEIQNDNSYLGENSYLNSDEPFYRGFVPFKIGKQEMGYYLAQNNQQINGILFRSNSSYSENFQEDTYLDMFIFQSGAKFDKKVVGLEKFPRSIELVKQATSERDFINRDYAPWLIKLTREKDHRQLLQEVYREQNLDLMDSINTEMYSEKYNKYMLYERNKDMVQAIDSLIKNTQKSIFSGVGAAHLPGTKGVIELLRAQGYTVTPLKGELTEKGEAIKEKIENKVNINFQDYTSSDNVFSLKYLNKIYDAGYGNYISPDLTNGSYLIISRINKFQYLYPNHEVNLENIKDLFFEYIPGDIELEKEITLQGFKGISVKNKLKNGDHQRYSIFETPFEIIIFKMGGEGKFVQEYGDEIFNSIQLKNLENNWITVYPFFNEFSIAVPSYYKFTNNNLFSAKTGTPYLEAYDSQNNSYYFLLQKKLTDTNYIEEDAFEEKIIIKRFMEELEKEEDNSITENLKNIKLKTIINNNKYYLLGSINASDEDTYKYFDSFKPEKATIKAQMKEIVDTAMHFTVKTYDKTPENTPYLYDYKNDKLKKKNAFNSANFSYHYYAPNKESVWVEYYKFNDYTSFENIDTFWNNVTEIEYYLKREKNQKIKNNQLYKQSTNNSIDVVEVVREDDPYANTNHEDTIEDPLRLKNYGKCKHLDTYPCFDLVLHRNNSTKQISKKFILNNGVLYTIMVQQDTLQTKSDFQDTFMSTFTPKDTLIGISPLEDKTQMLLSHLSSKDSLQRYAAFNSIFEVDFKEKHLPKIISFVKEHDFKDEELKHKSELIKNLDKVKKPESIQLLKDLYLESENNSEMQTNILEIFAKSQTKAQTQEILSLLKQDIAIAENSLNSVFIWYKNDSLATAEDLFPDLFAYTSIPEYKEQIIRLLNHLKEEFNYPPKKYKKIKDLLITEAQLSIKKMKNEELEYKANSYYNSYSYDYDLPKILNLLLPFYNKDNEVQKVFEKAKSIESPSFKIGLLEMLKRNNKPYKDISLDILKEYEKAYNAYEIINDLEDQELFDQYNISQEDVAIALLYNESYSNEIDKYEIVEINSIEKEENTYQYYIFKYINKEDDDRYYSNEEEKWKYASFAFLQQEGKIQIEPYISMYDEYDYKILDEDNPEEYERFLEAAQESILYKERKRVNIFFHPSRY